MKRRLFFIFIIVLFLNGNRSADTQPTKRQETNRVRTNDPRQRQETDIPIYTVEVKGAPGEGNHTFTVDENANYEIYNVIWKDGKQQDVIFPDGANVNVTILLRAKEGYYFWEEIVPTRDSQLSHKNVKVKGVEGILSVDRYKETELSVYVKVINNKNYDE